MLYLFGGGGGGGGRFLSMRTFIRSGVIDIVSGRTEQIQSCVHITYITIIFIYLFLKLLSGDDDSRVLYINIIYKYIHTWCIKMSRHLMSVTFLLLYYKNNDDVFNTLIYPHVRYTIAYIDLPISFLIRVPLMAGRQ